MKTANEPHKLTGLDGLRGVAAFAVLLFHIPRTPDKLVAPNGYLAVDFFLMLSGFVLSYAYQQRLDDGWALSKFLRVRTVRLYPLYLLGLLIGAALTAHSMADGSQQGSLGKTLLVFLCGVFLVPVFGFFHAGVNLYPLNWAAWSLFFEALANLAHAALLRRRVLQLLSVLLVAAIAGFISCVIRAGTVNLGPRIGHMTGGLLRTAAAYLFGVVLFRLWKAGHRLSPLPFPLLGAILLALLVAPDMGRVTLAYQLLVLYVAFPLLLASAVANTGALRFAPLYQAMGGLSYPVYILQSPCFGILHRLFKPSVTSHLPRFVVDAAFVVIPIVVALFAERFYDVPIRLHLKRSISHSPVAATP